MVGPFNRRGFLHAAMAGAAAGALPRVAAAQNGPQFRVSLSEWSLASSLAKKKLDHLDFARAAGKDLGFDAVEYVSRFFPAKPNDKYLAEINKRAAEHNLRQLLIVVVGQGRLGDPDAGKRAQAVALHRPWVETAKTLGCHSICVGAHSQGPAAEQAKLVAEGMAPLAEFAAKHEINLLVQNDTGCSADPEWVVNLLRQINSKSCGTLPNIGCIDAAKREKVIAKLIPLAKGATARSAEFDEQGMEKHVDYPQVIQAMLGAGFRGYLAVDYRGKKLDEYAGIRATKALLEKSRSESK